MSYTSTHTTSMNDQSALAEALTKLGFQPEVLQEGRKIRGHMSEMSRQHCDIILTKETTGRKADIGFSRAGNSNYEIVTDTYVNSDLRDLEAFTAPIKVEYTKVQAKRAARKTGATFIGQKVLPDGSVKLRFAKAIA